MPRRLLWILLPALSVGIASSSPAHGQRVGSAGILIVDMMPAGGERAAASRVFFINPSARHPEDVQVRARLDDLVNPDSVGSTEALREVLRTAGDHFTKHTSNRWVSKTGDSLFVFVVRPVNREANIDIKENSRKSRIEGDLVILARLAVRTIAPGSDFKGLGDFAADTVKASVSIKRRRLVSQRASVSIISTLAPDSAKKADTTRRSAKNAGTAEKDTVPSRVEAVLATGPREHLFMSADAAFTQARQVKYVEANQSLEPDTKPSEFLIGFNYSAGDLLDEDRTPSVRSFLRGIYAGVLIEASTRPFNQVATVVGARRNLPLLSRVVSFNTVSPYVGAVWLRDDHRETTDAGIKSKYGRANIIWGLSLNLDQALTWLGSN